MAKIGEAVSGIFSTKKGSSKSLFYSEVLPWVRRPLSKVSLETAGGFGSRPCHVRRGGVVGW